jgi:hypothetical protein
MADDKQAKEQIAEGMGEAGKQEKGKASGDAMTGRRGHGADSAHIGRDMAESSADKRSTGSDQKTHQKS